MKTAKQYDPTTAADPKVTERILTGKLEFDVLRKWIEGQDDDIKDRSEEYRHKPELMKGLVTDLEFAVAEVELLRTQTWEMVTAWIDLRRLMGE